MFRRGKNQPNIKNANQFIAGFFGDKPISVKFTSNPNTFARAYANRARRRHKQRWRIGGMGMKIGSQLQLGTSGRKHIIFVNKRPEMDVTKPTRMDLEETAAHEIFHAQFERYRRTIGKRLVMDSSELAAYIASLDYIRLFEPEWYNKIINAKIHQSPFYEKSSQFGSDVSVFIHSEFNPAQRREMIEELKNGNFSTRKQITRWLLNKLKANGSKQEEMLFKMEEYLKRKLVYLK